MSRSIKKGAFISDKLLKKALIPNSNVVADRMAEVSANAIEDCGKAPATPPPKKSP